jgi:hypothetical protein
LLPALALPHRIRDGRGIQQTLRVGMVRIRRYLFYRARFDNLTLIKHGHPMTDVSYDSQIV